MLNHYLLPSLIYFLAHSKLAQYWLNKIASIARRFLWRGNDEVNKIPKVAWFVCCIKKKLRGLGILNIVNLFDTYHASRILGNSFSPI